MKSVITEMGDVSPDKKAGCGLLNAVFGKRGFWPRRSTSASSLPALVGAGKLPTTPKRRRSGSDESQYLEVSSNVSDTSPEPMTKAPDCPKIPPIQQYHHHQYPHGYHHQQTPHARNPSQEPFKNVNQTIGYVNQGRRVPKETVGISGELETMIADHQKHRGNSNNLLRASSGNVMIFSDLGNLRQPGGCGGKNVADNLVTTSSNGPKYPNSGMGNVVKKPSAANPREDKGGEGSLCRALSTRMDPEQLKIMGNEDYKNGNFAEALALYDAAISIDPHTASYRSNKSAALTALGRTLEAVFECREAIRIEPHYHRAHHRLASLYLRLGDGEKAMYHYKHAGPEADNVDIAKVKSLQMLLNKCTEARSLRDWNSLIKDTNAAISSGADSALQIYALQAEAFLKLNMHQEAEDALKRGPKFEDDHCTRYFGPIGNANLLATQARVDMAFGRFDESVAKATRATRLDPNSKEANMVMRKAKAVATARGNGNQLFKAGKYYEAANVYGEGIEIDHYNSVLLCNRAVCGCKLGRFDKAIEDCTAALNVRPTYSKARLRRADCFAKLEKWEASIQDYEILEKELPEDEEVKKGLLEAKTQLHKHRGDM